MNGSGGGRRCFDSDGKHGASEGREMPSGRAETDMGERQDGDGRGRDGHRATSDALATCFSSVDALLAAAVRGRLETHSEGEARAVDAFREARAQGKRTARTRRRDDWRPNARRRVQLSIRTTLAVLLASLTLGGVAFAAIGSAARHDNGRGDRDGHGEWDRRTGTSYEVPGGPGDVDHHPGADRPAGERPPQAGDTDAKTDRDTGKKHERPTKDSGQAERRARSAKGAEGAEQKPDKAGRPGKPPHTEAEQPKAAEETKTTRPEKK